MSSTIEQCANTLEDVFKRLCLVCAKAEQLDKKMSATNNKRLETEVDDDSNRRRNSNRGG